VDWHIHELHRQMEVIAACILTATFAVWCACDDDLQIAMNKPVRHVRQWLLRASVVTLLCVVIGLPWLAIGLAGLFSAVFRYALNRLRGLSPWYVSPSNWYDYLLILFSANGYTDWKLSEYIRLHGKVYFCDLPSHLEWRNRNEGSDQYWRDQWQSVIHRAGKIAYAVELVVFVSVLLMHVL
jgi:hypothetical protein